MSNIVNEIIGNKNKTNSYGHKRNNNNYNKRRTNWRERQNQDRKEIYETMDRMTTIVGNDSEKFVKYLDIQSRFPKHSVGNCLVILEKAPNSTKIKDKTAWEEKGVELISNPKSIKILEPNKVDGKIYYNPKEVYDITQTNAPKEENTPNYSDKRILEAVIPDLDVPKKAVDKLPDESVGAVYNRDENVLYVCKEMDRELLFQTLFQAVANIEMRDEENSKIKNFKSYCISYMLCKKYGIDVSGFRFVNLPPEISQQKDTKGIRGELNEIKSKFESIDARIYVHFEKKNKERNKTAIEKGRQV